MENGLFGYRDYILPKCNLNTSRIEGKLAEILLFALGRPLLGELGGF